MAEKTQSNVARPTRGAKKGITLILRHVMNDFDNGFDRLFPDATDTQIAQIMEAADWLANYADADWDV